MPEREHETFAGNDFHTHLCDSWNVVSFLSPSTNRQMSGTRDREKYCTEIIIVVIKKKNTHRLSTTFRLVFVIWQVFILKVLSELNVDSFTNFKSQSWTSTQITSLKWFHDFKLSDGHIETYCLAIDISISFSPCFHFSSDMSLSGSSLPTNLSFPPQLPMRVWGPQKPISQTANLCAFMAFSTHAFTHSLLHMHAARPLPTLPQTAEPFFPFSHLQISPLSRLQSALRCHSVMALEISIIIGTTLCTAMRPDGGCSWVMRYHTTKGHGLGVH